MNRAILTFGVGPHAELVEIAEPSYKRFADRHGYDLIVHEPIDSIRPPSWWKVPMLVEALEEYDEVLFMGADLVIVDDSRDLEVPDWYWHALVSHSNSCGEVPNADVWLVRQPMIELLHDMWAMTEYTNHGWWEQCAVMKLMGYEFEPLPSKHVWPTELYERTFFLEDEWNVHRWCDPVEHPRFQHATMWEDRASIMRAWEAEASRVKA